MTAALTPNPKVQFFAADGTPLVGGKLYSYVAGTTTPLATYINYAGVTANTNPVILDSRGEANVWLDNVLYKLALYDANDALIWTVDNVSAINNGIFSGPVAGATGTFSGALTAASGAFSGPVSGTTGTFSGALTALSGTFTSNVQMASLNGGQVAGMRNKIINGKMDVAQRGTSFPAIATGAYSLDRWLTAYVTNTGVATVSQQSDAPTNEFQNSLRANVTTADTNIAAGEYFILAQRVEGYNVRDLIGRTFTMSFWARSSKTGVHCVSFRNSVFDRSYVAEYSIASANTWEFKTVTVSGGLILAGTWNWTTGQGLEICWALASGATFNTTAGAWQTGNFTGTANQVNCLDTIGNIFAITGVQLEVGSVATPFEHRPIGLELALCQRYYYQIGGNASTEDFAVGVFVSATDYRFVVRHPQRMRVGPAVAALGTISNFQATATATYAASAFALNTSSVDSINASFTVAGATGGQGGYARSNNAANILTVNAEL